VLLLLWPTEDWHIYLCKAKKMCTLGVGGSLKKEHCAGGSQDLSLSLGSIKRGVLSSRKLDYVSLTLRVWAVCHQLLPHVRQWGEVFLRAAEVASQQDPTVCPKPFCSHQHEECDSLSASKPWFSAIRLPNSLPHLYVSNLRTK
jgi:hypothetical protein